MRLSKWTVEALLLSDDLAKLIEKHRQEDNANESEGDNAMTIVEEGSGEAPVIEDGLYDLTVVSAVTGIREGPDKYNPEVVDAPIVHVNMAVGGTEDEEGKPVVLRSTMNLKFSRGGSYPPSTLFLYAQAFGVAPASGPFDTDWLVGKTAQGMVRTEEEGKWPKVINESLIPAKKTNGTKPAPADDEAPFDVESNPLNDWLTAMRGVGFSTKEIIDLCKSRFEKLPRELSDLQRELLGKEYGI